ncbi:uncharacterized protein EAF01_006653 [Botrytis porri]|uniref:uncharacterized protein n=1 Tax=Botrytis porri TaxID=87229 RepID=UPI001900906D|nr:uncharacterized protein EAF01_006653 [Botrytis porri]KAF7903604.1 hypothetical protein EAF01_006653 [Botrytis porri]
MTANSKRNYTLLTVSYKRSLENPAPQRFLMHSVLEFPMILWEFFRRPSPYDLRTIAKISNTHFCTLILILGTMVDLSILCIGSSAGKHATTTALFG